MKSAAKSDKIEFSEFPVDDKSYARAIRGQIVKFKIIVAVVDASGLVGLRKH